MNAHKVTRELFNLEEKEFGKMYEILRLISEARRNFDLVGEKLTYDRFVQYVERNFKTYNTSGKIDKYHAEIYKIVEGDNLDKIEEAAKKKKLL